MPFGQLMMVFNVAQEREVSMDDVKKEINERRIRKGQAPMKPAPRARR